MTASGEIELLIIEDDDIAALSYQNTLNKQEAQKYNYTVRYDLKSGTEELRKHNYDAVLLDLNLPDSNEKDTIESIKELSLMAPLLVATSSSTSDLAIKALNNGAQDYIGKSPEGMASLALNILYARERFYLRTELKKQQDYNQQLLSSMLPKVVIHELEETGSSQTRHIMSASVMFTDFAGFTKSSMTTSAPRLVRRLGKYFDAFDYLAEMYNVEKIKTIGDSYMAASGIPNASETHSIRIILAALAFREVVETRRKSDPDDPHAWGIRIGINSGPVIAGIIGNKKIAYDVYGETVNIASRLEQDAECGAIQVSQSTYDLTKDFFEYDVRESCIKDLGNVQIYSVVKLKPSFARSSNGIIPKEEWLLELLKS